MRNASAPAAEWAVGATLLVFLFLAMEAVVAIFPTYGNGPIGGFTGQMMSAGVGFDLMALAQGGDSKPGEMAAIASQGVVGLTQSLTESHNTQTLALSMMNSSKQTAGTAAQITKSLTEFAERLF